ncbi:BZIP transcription factor, partial [Trifolium medium]|nr:BZIP transcription factor [Trifolium medium]
LSDFTSLLSGYTGTMLFKNGKLSDIIGELQLLVKGLEKSGDQDEGGGEVADPIAAQVTRLVNEVR